MRTTEAQAIGIEVRGKALVVNVNRRDKWSAYTSTVTIPLDHVTGVEADPEIERKMWRGWAFGQHSMWRSRIFGTNGEYRVPGPGREVLQPPPLVRR